MTDHKAHVRVLKGFAAAYTGETGEAFRAAIAALTAAPAASEATINFDPIDSKLIDAASEGEDGAVAQLRDAHERRLYNVTAAQALAPLLAPGYRLIYRDAFRWKDANGSVLSNHYDGMDAAQLAADFGHQLVADLTFAAVIRDTRPAAQVAATPKHDEGREGPSYAALLIIVQSVCGALERAGITDCDDPGEAIDVMRERYERRIHGLTADPDAALATQPAARRVTDDPRVAELIEAVEAFKGLPDVEFTAASTDEAACDRLDAALESFAQPAEGVSGG